MSTEQHEALKLADRLIEAACVVDAGRPAVMSDFRRRAAANLQSQHALIVQMAKALNQCGQALEEVAMKGVEPTDAIDDGLISTLNTAFIAATQYLKGPKT